MLVADTSDDAEKSENQTSAAPNSMGVAELAYRMPEGVNGLMKANGILRFNDMINM